MQGQLPAQFFGKWGGDIRFLSAESKFEGVLSHSYFEIENIGLEKLKLRKIVVEMVAVFFPVCSSVDLGM